MEEFEIGKCYKARNAKIRVAGEVTTLKCGKMLIIEEAYRACYSISTIETEAVKNMTKGWKAISEDEFKEALNVVGK